MEYSNLKFDIKNYFYQIFTTCKAQTGPKIKSTQNLLKFGTFDISNMPISILMSKIIFIKFQFFQISIHFENFSFCDQFESSNW